MYTPYSLHFHAHGLCMGSHSCKMVVRSFIIFENNNHNCSIIVDRIYQASQNLFTKISYQRHVCRIAERAAAVHSSRKL